MEQSNTKTIDRFELTKVVDHEGPVTVYLAHDPHLDRDLVIRVIDLPDVDSKAHEHVDFQIRSMQELRHSNLARVLDHGVFNGLDFMATSYIKGPTLSELVRNNKGIEPKQVALLVGKLALAISEMHDAGLVHGYLSPDGIVIGEDGAPVIADLGLATEYRARFPNEHSEFRNQFQAPEVVVSNGEEKRPESDVYSLAAIGYFVLYQRPPESAEDLLKESFLPELDDRSNDEYRKAFSKALSISARHRFATPRGLARAMDSLYRITPLTHPPGGADAMPKSETEPGQFEQFDLQQIDGSHVIHLHDASVLSTEALAQTKHELFAMLQQCDPKRLIVNFASVRFCSSATVGILIQLNKEIKKRDTLLYLCGMRDSIREVFRVLNLEGTVFQIRDTVTNALKSVD